MTLLRALALISVGFALSGCGADGEPIRPSAAASVGVSNSGAYVGGVLGLNRGPFNLYLGF